MSLIEDKAREIYDKGNKYVYLVTEDGNKERKRIGKTADGSIIVMKGKSRRGYYLSGYYQLKDVVEIVSRTTVQDRWLKTINKAISLLEDSGLWVKILPVLKTARDIGYDKINKAYNQYWAKHEGKDYTECQKINTQLIKEIDPRLISISKDDGSEYPNTEILWYMNSPLKIKKMNFGSRSEEYYKEIKEAMQNKQKYEVPRLELNYDNSFEYNPEADRAWYSEEYRGCGNGHYYLALDNQYAIFWEDD
jgi:hypothetical protein